MKSRRFIAAFIGLVVAVALIGSMFQDGAQAAPTAAFQWSMPDRFGTDTNRDHVIDEIDLATPASFVNPSSWRVDFDACDAEGNPQDGTTYSWTFAGSPPTEPSTSCRANHDFPQVNTSYDVTLTVTNSEGTDAKTETITPRDHVIVAMGDSGASGEGNPDRLEPDFSGKTFKDFSFEHTWNNAACHRSALAGPAQAALRLEQRDPHSSVTFVHVACSGARITRGLLSTYQGIEPAKKRLDCDDPALPNPSKPGETFYIKYPDPSLDAPTPTDPACLPSQLDQVKQILGDTGVAGARGRPIDAISVLAGINDIAFSKALYSCLLEDNCATDRSEHLLDPLGRIQSAPEFLEPRFAQLPDRYAALADALVGLNLRQADASVGANAGHIWFGEYPDPSTDADGTTCQSSEVGKLTGYNDDIGKVVRALLGGAALDPDAGVVSQEEWAWARTAVIGRLGTAVQSAVDAANADHPGRFSMASGSTAAFGPHGYCARDTWFRDIAGSFLYQRDPEGSFHPNRAGHFHAYALPLEDFLAPHLGITAPELPAKVPGDIEAFEAISQGLAPLFDILSRTDLGAELEKLWPSKLRKADDQRDRPGAEDEITAKEVQQFFQKVTTKLRDYFAGALAPDALSDLDILLDDLDGVNGTADDGHFGPLVLDVEGRVAPHGVSSKYELLLDVKLTGPVEALGLDVEALQLDVPPPQLDISTTLRFFVEPERPSGRVYLQTSDEPAIRLGLGASLELPADQPLTANLGPLEVKATGPAEGPAVDIDTALLLKPRDPDGDGRITSDELVNGSFSGSFDIECDPTSHIDLDVHLGADLAGIGGEVAALTLHDANVCDGIADPDLTFADGAFEDLQSLSPTDIVDAFLALAQALERLQESGDVNLPFAKSTLSEGISIAEDIRGFLQAAGYIAPPDGVAAPGFSASALRVPSLQSLASDLESHLGLPEGALNLRYDKADRRIEFDLSLDPSVDDVALPVDLGVLERAGLVAPGSAASLTLDANATVGVGVGIDVRLDPADTPTDMLRSVTDRLLISTESTGVTIDGSAMLHVDVDGRIGGMPVDVTIDDGAGGAVQLLAKPAPSEPLVSLGLSGGSDGYVSLADMLSNDPARFSVNADVNAGLAPVTARAIARLGEGRPELGRGTVAVSWADLSEVSGPNGPQVTVDGQFGQELLRFAESVNDPVKLAGLILGGVRDGADAIARTARENEQAARALPLVGKGYDDVVAGFETVSQVAGQLADAHQKMTVADLEAALEQALGNAFGLSPEQAAQIVDLELDTSQPRTALVLHLDVCRASNGAAGCGAPAPIAGTFNLDVDGLGLVGVTGQADLSLNYLARVRLDLALELPAVLTGTPENPEPVIAPDQAPAGLFILGSTGVEANVSASVNLNQGGDGTFRVYAGPYQASLGIRGTEGTTPVDDPASAALGVRFAIGTGGPADERLTPTAWATKVLENVQANGITDHSSAWTPAACPGDPVEACANLPLYLKTATGSVQTSDGSKWELLGDAPITFRAPDLFAPSTWTADVPASIGDDLADRAFSITSVIEGIRYLLGEAKVALDGASIGQDVPVLGKTLDAGADLAADLEAVAARVSELAARVESATTVGALRDEARNFLFQKLGPKPAGLGVLQDTNGSGSVTIDDVDLTATCGTEACAPDASLVDVTDVKLRLSVGGTGEASTPRVELGVPGMRFATEGTASASVGWRLDVGVGIDEEGFYLDPANAAGRPGELTLEADASLPASIDATLAGLPVTITDKHTGKDLDILVGMDLLGGSGDKLRLTELVERGSNLLDRDSVRLFAQGCADVLLGFEVRTPDITGSGQPNALPGIVGDLDLDANWNGCPGSEGDPVDLRDGLTGEKPGGGPVGSLAVRNVSLDLGSTASRLVGPVAREVRRVTGPLEPVVNRITRPVPIVSDLAQMVGKDSVTWLDAWKASQELSGDDSMAVTAVETIVEVVKFARQFDAASTPNASIPIVDTLAIDLDAAKSVKSDPDAAFDELIEGTPVVNDVMAAARDAGWNIESKLGEVADESKGAEFRFPVLDEPTLLVQLLFGKDIDLAVFDAGPLKAEAGFDFYYGLPVAKVGIRGSASIDGRFVLSYDTAGIRAAVAQKPLKLSSLGALVHGFGINDLDDSGNDVPEIRLDANLELYAYAGVPGANVTASGGVEGWVEADLIDPDQDGKLRFAEIKKRIRNPHCLFDTSGRIQAYARLTGELGPFEASKDLVKPYVLLEIPSIQQWCTDMENSTSEPEIPVPVLAHQTGSTLYLHVGPDAGLRGTGGSINEVVTVTQDVEGEVDVTMDGFTQHYGSPTAKITEVRGSGGTGNDQLRLESPLDPAVKRVTARFNGNVGNDTLIGGEGNDVFDGGDGNDTLEGRAGTDSLYGQAGDDVLVGGDGNDTLHAHAGDDTIDGGADPDSINPGDGRDVVYGGDGNDTVVGTNTTGPDIIEGGRGADGVTGSSDADVIIGGSDDPPVAGSQDSLRGGPGDDCIVDDDGTGSIIDTPDGATCTARRAPGLGDIYQEGLYGEDGNDLLIAGDGRENLNGGAGDDTIEAGSGTKSVYGGTGNDRIVAGDGEQTLRGEDGDDVVVGGPGDDGVYGGAGNDTLTGDEGDDTVQGGDGNDSVDGGVGVDIVHGNNDDDVVAGGDGDDTRVSGDAGNDEVYGGAGNDQVWGDDSQYDGSSAGDGNDVVRGGAGNDTLTGGFGDDDLDGELGDDLAYGGPDDDVVNGGEGADVLHGRGGFDRMNGGPGNDFVVADVGTLMAATNPPSTWPSGTPKMTIQWDATIGGPDEVAGGGGDDFLYDLDLDPATYVRNTSLRATVTVPPAPGTGTVSSGSTYMSYNPNLSQQGSATFEYQVTDATTGGVVGTGTGHVINGVNRPPVAVDDSVRTAQGRTYRGNVLGNDHDPDGDRLTATPATGSSEHGTYEVRADGSFTYVPDELFGGPSDSFPYEVGDGQGGTATANVVVTIDGDTTPPLIGCNLPSGWSATDVEVGCIVYDVGVGLADGTPSTMNLQTNIGDGNEGTAVLEADPVCDKAGNCTGPSTFEVLVDRKAPAITSTNDGQVYPAGTTGVTKDVQCTDGGSGLAEGACAEHGQPLDLTPGTHSFTVVASDAVGNQVAEAFSYVVQAAPETLVSIGDAKTREGDEGVHTVLVPVSLSQPSSEPVTVSYEVLDNTALAGSDYIGDMTGTVTFEPGEGGMAPTVRYIGFGLVADTVIEKSENFKIRITGVTGATVKRATGKAVIVNDDALKPKPGLSVGEVSIVEGHGSTRTANVIVRLDRPAAERVTFTVRTAPKTATEGADYTHRERVLTIEAGETQAVFSVPIEGDLLVEKTETVLVEIVSATGAPVVDRSGVIRILNDDK